MKILGVITIFFIAGLSYLFGTILSNPKNWGFCMDMTDSYICSLDSAINFGWPLIIGGQLLALVGIALLAANERAWRRWVLFSIWYVPISIFIIFVLFPAPFLIFEITRDVVTRDLGILYVFITFGIVAWSRLFKEPPKLPPLHPTEQ